MPLTHGVTEETPLQYKAIVCWSPPKTQLDDEKQGRNGALGSDRLLWEEELR